MFKSCIWTTIKFLELAEQRLLRKFLLLEPVFRHKIYSKGSFQLKMSDCNQNFPSLLLNLYDFVGSNCKVLRKIIDRMGSQLLQTLLFNLLRGYLNPLTLLYKSNKLQRILSKLRSKNPKIPLKTLQNQHLSVQKPIVLPRNFHFLTFILSFFFKSLE